MKKKIIAGVMMVCMLALAGCGQSGTTADSNTNGNTQEQMYSRSFRRRITIPIPMMH